VAVWSAPALSATGPATCSQCARPSGAKVISPEIECSSRVRCQHMPDARRIVDEDDLYAEKHSAGEWNVDVNWG